MSKFDNKPQVLFGVLDKEGPTWPNALKGPNHPVARFVIPFSYSSYIIKLASCKEDSTCLLQY